MIATGDVLPNLLARRAVEQPGRVFVRHVDGTDWTYARLERRVLAWAATLHEAGVAAGDRVLVMVPTSLEAIAIWMAVARLGAIEVPPNTAYRGRFLAHVIENADARCAIVEERYLERFEELRPELPPGAFPPIVPADAAVDGREPPVGVLVEPQEHDVATIIYTSGTTGASKGVLDTWAQVHKTAEACPPIDDLGPDDVRYSPFPLFHMSGKLAVAGAAMTNGTLVIRERWSTSEFWGDVDRFGVTTTIIIGSAAVFLEKLPPRPDDAAHTLRNVLLGPPPDDPIGFCERFGLRGSVTFNMTEISCPTSTGWDMDQLARGVHGRTRPGYDVRVVDDRDRPVPAGEVGEIVVRSDEPWWLMQGYWRMEDKTVEAWRNLWFHTGDLGRLNEHGELTFLDRKKDAIRRRGENISSMELEAEIAEYDGILEAAVVGVPSEVGEEDVKAFLVVRDTTTFEPAALLEWLADRVPAFMLPRYIQTVDHLPKTPTEKIQKHELRQLDHDDAWQRPESAPDAPARVESSTAPPGNPT